MVFVSYLLLILVTIAGSISLYYIFKKFDNKKGMILKVLSLVLALVITIRYMLGEGAISTTRGLNMFTPFNDDIYKTVISVLLIWFSYASILMLILNSFFKINNAKNFVKFFSLPVLLLDVIFFKWYSIAIIGTDAYSSFDFRLVLMMLELIISISMITSTYISKDYFKVSKKEIKTLLITLAPALIAIMPAYVLQALYGYASFSLEFKSFSPEHRLMLYAGIIIPVLICIGFKKQSYEVKRFSMLYLSLAVLWSFMFKYGFSELADPLSWPVHLCHTAMFVIPICLIFQLDKLFYFSFFINVMGAFLAMLIPNTVEGVNVLATSNVLFWINHFSAFFMPVLLVALKLFKRPKLKQWIYSMIAFAVYFIFILIINSWFSNYGSVDYFFLNSDFITDKLGKWAEKTRDFTTTFNIGKLEFTFYPIYQTLFFIVYCFISVMMWFIYEQLFQMWDLEEDRVKREEDYRRMQKELAEILKGRGEGEPMSGDYKPCLELKKFSKKYGVNKHYSVKDVSFKVNGGEIFGFLGPNGAGKSTIIKSIVGMQTITDGTIEVCGFDVERQSVQAKKELGFVPDHYALYENLTGREYINYIADLYGVSQEDRDKRINKYVKNFNLKNAFDNQMKTYSHGMKQKITIMAALVHNPKVWILDEPLTGLDPNSIFEVKECMKEHAAAGNIVFFSSHIIDVVEKICDRIAIIKKGTLLEDVMVKDLDEKGISLESFYLETINSKKESVKK